VPTPARHFSTLIDGEEKWLIAYDRMKLEVAHPNAAGIDIGSGSHFVAVRADADEMPVREFSSFTQDLEALARWLTQCGVDVVAMESTGVYWIPLYELLVRAVR
jgi:hypothetical protein